MMRARGWVSERQRIRPPISSRNSTRRSMLFSPIPRWKRGLKTLATRRCKFVREVRQVHSRGHSEMGQGGEIRGHQAGLIAHDRIFHNLSFRESLDGPPTLLARADEVIE